MKMFTWALSVVLVAGMCSTARAQADRKPLFGELHIHTGWSFDAYVFGVRATPDDAYNFAKELGIPHPEDLHATIQDRAYTSPIWYDHH